MGLGVGFANQKQLKGNDRAKWEVERNTVGVQRRHWWSGESCWGESGRPVWQESTGLVAKDMAWNPSSTTLPALRR